MANDRLLHSQLLRAVVMRVLHGTVISDLIAMSVYGLVLIANLTIRLLCSRLLIALGRLHIITNA